MPAAGPRWPLTGGNEKHFSQTDSDVTFPWSLSMGPYCLLEPVNLWSELPWWFSGKESACNAGDAGLIPGLGRSSGEANGKPLQNFCLDNPTDRGAWRATVRGIGKSRTRQQLSRQGARFLCVESVYRKLPATFLFTSSKEKLSKNKQWVMRSRNEESRNKAWNMRMTSTGKKL